MRFRGCPVTGRMMHKFDPATHRCVCGRWERGYAPPKEPVYPKDECQICERAQAVRGGVMVLHGYERPGLGFVQGRCFGVGHAPYPATDALEVYLNALLRHMAYCQDALNRLSAKESMTFRWTTGYGQKKQEHSVEVPRGAQTRYDPTLQVTVLSFDIVMEREHRRLGTKLASLESERDRVRARIENAKKS